MGKKAQNIGKSPKNQGFRGCWTVPPFQEHPVLLILHQLSSLFIKIVVMLNKFSIITAFLFCVGLTLTLWRSYDCLQKHLYNKLGTKFNMVLAMKQICRH